MYQGYPCQKMPTFLREMYHSHNRFDHLAFQKREPFVASQVGIRQTMLVQPQLVQQRGVLHEHEVVVAGGFHGMAEERPVALEESDAVQPEAALEKASSPETDDGGDEFAVTAPTEAQEPDTGATAAEGGLPVDEGATDDVADRAEERGAARAPAGENEGLQDSWEPIDLGAILQASLEPAPDEEDGEDNTAETVASPAARWSGWAA